MHLSNRHKFLAAIGVKADYGVHVEESMLTFIGLLDTCYTLWTFQIFLP